MTPDNCSIGSNGIAGTVTSVGPGTFDHAVGAPFEYDSIGKVVVINELTPPASFFNFQLTYGTDVTKDFSFNFVFEKCPCNSFQLA